MSGKMADSARESGVIIPDFTRDILESDIPRDVLAILLADRTTGKNIMWMTDGYVKLESVFGVKMGAQDEISADVISRPGNKIIRPRVDKSKEEQRERKAAEATIELNERTKIQNQLLREQNQRLNETIMQLKDQHGNKSLPSTANASYQFDVFVSHANDNKEEFVNALTAELSRLGISIWYDANILDWVDNWKLQIANGLKKCRFGIVVVSPEFLGREWTEKELNELLQRQNETGEKVILPLLYKLTISDMKKRYPQLADFQARIIAPNDDVRDIVIDFARILIRALKG